VLDRVLTARGGGFVDVRADMGAAHAAAWDAADTRLLELCRVRIASLLGCTAEATARTPGTDVDPALLDAVAGWPTDLRFDARDRAALAFAEHYVVDVASLADDTAVALREHLGDQGLQDFVSALLVVEQRIRLRLVWDRLLGGD
jgi:alkylhydroperoxidase family enzyme